MAKNKKDSIDSFQGLFLGTADKEPMQGQETIENIEIGGEIQKTNKISSPKNQNQRKKPGRPKINRELKRKYTLTILPSLYEESSAMSRNNGKSLSELISDLLVEYVKKNKSK